MSKGITKPTSLPPQNTHVSAASHVQPSPQEFSHNNDNKGGFPLDPRDDFEARVQNAALQNQEKVSNLFSGIGRWARSRFDRAFSFSSKTIKKPPQNSAIDQNIENIAINHQSPATGQEFYERAAYHLQLQQNEEALKDLGEAIKLNPNNPELLVERGYLYTMLERHQEALVDYRKAIEINPKESIFYYGKVYSDFSLGNYFEALKSQNSRDIIDHGFPLTISASIVSLAMFAHVLHKFIKKLPVRDAVLVASEVMAGAFPEQHVRFAEAFDPRIKVRSPKEGGDVLRSVLLQSLHNAIDDKNPNFNKITQIPEANRKLIFKEIVARSDHSSAGDANYTSLAPTETVTDELKKFIEKELEAAVDLDDNGKKYFTETFIDLHELIWGMKTIITDANNISTNHIFNLRYNEKPAGYFSEVAFKKLLKGFDTITEKFLEEKLFVPEIQSSEPPIQQSTDTTESIRRRRPVSPSPKPKSGHLVVNIDQVEQNENIDGGRGSGPQL